MALSLIPTGEQMLTNKRAKKRKILKTQRHYHIHYSVIKVSKDVDMEIHEKILYCDLANLDEYVQ